MAAAGPVYRQAGWSGNPFLLPLSKKEMPAGRQVATKSRNKS